MAAGCARRSDGGERLWLEISHIPSRDLYAATLTARISGEIRTIPIDSIDATEALRDSTLLGFVEGTSEGHISARGVNDPRGRFGWSRQDYDQEPGSTSQGGRVWEHWCTSRDLSDSEFSKDLFKAYVQLCHAAGDLFAPTVARGRTDYGHPAQLREMVRAGFTSEASATYPIRPTPLPRAAELLMHEATPQSAFEAIDTLPWADRSVTYYMYPRKIGSWAG
jgi:hypothetical protein